MKRWHPFLIFDRRDSQVHDPVVGQAGSDQEPRDPFGVGDVAFVKMESATLLVGEEGLNFEPLSVVPAGVINRREIGDRMNGLLAVLPPPRSGLNGFTSLPSE